MCAFQLQNQTGTQLAREPEKCSQVCSPTGCIEESRTAGVELKTNDNRMERARLGNWIAMGSNPGSALMNLGQITLLPLT